MKCIENANLASFSAIMCFEPRVQIRIMPTWHLHETFLIYLPSYLMQRVDKVGTQNRDDPGRKNCWPDPSQKAMQTENTPPSRWDNMSGFLEEESRTIYCTVNQYTLYDRNGKPNHPVFMPVLLISRDVHLTVSWIRLMSVVEYISELLAVMSHDRREGVSGPECQSSLQQLSRDSSVKKVPGQKDQAISTAAAASPFPRSS